MNTLPKTKEQCLKELELAQAEIARLQLVISEKAQAVEHYRTAFEQEQSKLRQREEQLAKAQEADPVVTREFDLTGREDLLRNIENQQRTLQAVLDNMPAGLFMVEAPSGRPILSNKRAEEILGRGISPITVREGLNVVYQAYKYGTDELYPSHEMPIVAGLFGQSQAVDDMEVRRPDGTRVLLNIVGAPVFDTEGNVAASVVVFQDISEVRKAADERRRNQAQLAEALSIARMAYWEFDVNRGVFIFNDQFYNIMGTSVEEMGGYEITPEMYAACFLPEDRNMWGAEIEQAIQTTDPNYRREFERGFIRRDKSEGYLTVRFWIEKDAQGRTVRLMGANQDITEQRRAQEMIAKRAAELATVAEIVTTVSTIQPPEEMLQTVVDLTKQAFGLCHAHVYLMDKGCALLVLSTGAGPVGRRMAAEGRQIPVDLETSVIARAVRVRQGVIVNNVQQDPDYLPHLLMPETRSEMAVPMIVGDNVLGVIDIQDNKAGRFSQEDVNIMTTLAAQVAVALQNAELYAEQSATVERLRELDHLKSAFLANMSHELRTPLNSILGFADVLLLGLDGPLTGTMNSDIRLIEKNGKHLLSLINDVLDMAKIEAGKMNLTFEKFILRELIEETIDITSSLVREKGLYLFIEPNVKDNLELKADRIRLRQVLINVVSNAVKFTDQGGITIRVDPDPEGQKIFLTIQDTGIGIPQNKLELIFESFSQVDPSTTRKTGGTGLGLPISRHLVRMHGGNLWAESSGIQGEGSRFVIELPFEALPC